jgi:hypothetical protein
MKAQQPPNGMILPTKFFHKPPHPDQRTFRPLPGKRVVGQSDFHRGRQNPFLAAVDLGVINPQAGHISLRRISRHLRF